jgi:hypothetical protein
MSSKLLAKSRHGALKASCDKEPNENLFCQAVIFFRFEW